VLGLWDRAFLSAATIGQAMWVQIPPHTISLKTSLQMNFTFSLQA
jgi:hypothetical protein